jgi:hypothetical protein
VRLLFGVELQGYAADRSDALQHGERMACVFGVFKAGNHGLGAADLLSEFGLSEPGIFTHFADKHSQVNLLQRAREGLPLAFAATPFDKFAVPVAFDGLLHKPHSFRISILAYKQK